MQESRQLQAAAFLRRTNFLRRHFFCEEVQPVQAKIQRIALVHLFSVRNFLRRMKHLLLESRLKSASRHLEKQALRNFRISQLFSRSINQILQSATLEHFYRNRLSLRLHRILPAQLKMKYLQVLLFCPEIFLKCFLLRVLSFFTNVCSGKSPGGICK